MGALQDLYAAPQSGNNIPATLNANKPAVATTLAQAQIASQPTVNATARVLSSPTLPDYLK
jgi:hypothetical protein